MSVKATVRGRQMPPDGMSEKEALTIVGGLSDTTKMPGFSYSLSAKNCPIGKLYKKITGSVCASCYACKGRYVFGPAQVAARRREAALKNPQWIDAMVFLMGTKIRRVSSYFRWHDAGELQGMEHLKMIIEVARRTPFIKHWLPTKDFALINRYLATGGKFPKNLTVRLSAVMIDTLDISNPYQLPVAFVFTKSKLFTKHLIKGMNAEGYGAKVCHATVDKGPCDNCRLCWNRKVKTVIYQKH